MHHYMLMCCGTNVGAIRDNDAGELLLTPSGVSYRIEHEDGGVNRRGDTSSAVPFCCAQCERRVMITPSTAAEFITSAAYRDAPLPVVIWPPDDVAPWLVELTEQLGGREYSVLAFRDLCYFVTKLDRP